MASIQEYLDLRKSPWNREENNIYRATKRSIAESFARKWGWSAQHVKKACNHIEAWWIVAQCNGDQMTFLQRNGEWITLPYPGFIKK